MNFGILTSEQENILLWVISLKYLAFFFNLVGNKVYRVVFCILSYFHMSEIKEFIKDIIKGFFLR